MTLNDANKKVTAAVEGLSGRFAIISLLSIIAGTSTWIVKTEVDQGLQQTIILERMVNLQHDALERSAKTDADLQSMHRSLEQVDNSTQQLEVRFGEMLQRLNDMQQPRPTNR